MQHQHSSDMVAVSVALDSVSTAGTAAATTTELGPSSLLVEGIGSSTCALALQTPKSTAEAINAHDTEYFLDMFGLL